VNTTGCNIIFNASMLKIIKQHSFFSAVRSIRSKKEELEVRKNTRRNTNKEGTKSSLLSKVCLANYVLHT